MSEGEKLIPINIEDEMKNMPEKKKAICETVQCLSSLFLMLL